MKHYFLRSGTAFTPADESALNLHEKLPPGNYVIRQWPQNGPLYFDQVEAFTPPRKVYGQMSARVQRIMQTFNDRESATGALFLGEKGSGKSLMAKLCAIEGFKQDMPCIIVSQPWCGEQFNQLIQSLNQDAVILFDEFEKVYHKQEHQHEILTLLDGVFPTKKLFILTVNDQWAVDKHMKNRPGRLFYMLDFKGLEQDFIKDYCDDKLVDKTQAESVAKVSAMFAAFNFDMLQALVQEMNRYGESAYDALKMLNARPDGERAGLYDVVVQVPGQVVVRHTPTEWRGNPTLAAKITFGLVFAGSKEAKDKDGFGRSTSAGSYHQDPYDDYDGMGGVNADATRHIGDDKISQKFELRVDSLVEINPHLGQMVYKQDGITVTFQRRKDPAFSYSHLA